MPRRLRTYDAKHIPAVVVPPEGASCATCRYLAHTTEGRPYCTNKHYRKWSGTILLIDPLTGQEVPPNRFCTDWYDPAERYGRTL